jgi:hypothetical protein
MARATDKEEMPAELHQPKLGLDKGRGREKKIYQKYILVVNVCAVLHDITQHVLHTHSTRARSPAVLYGHISVKECVDVERTGCLNAVDVNGATVSRLVACDWVGGWMGGCGF